MSRRRTAGALCECNGQEMWIYDIKNDSISIKDPEMLSFISDIYKDTRYLEYAKDDDLIARLDGLIANLVSFCPEGEPLFRAKNGRAAIAFIELLEEFNLRRVDIEPLLHPRLHKYMGLFNGSDIERIQIQLEKFRGKKCLFKFTKAEYVDAILNGEVRFRTASSYNDIGLSIAIRDDGLNIQHRLLGLRLTTKDGKTIPVKDNKITAKAAGDYYVSCFSSNFKLRFFPLFDSDRCVVIGDSEKFVDAVIKHQKKNFPNSISYLAPSITLTATGS